MKGLISIMSACLLISCAIGCSSKSNAVLMDIGNRTAQSFIPPMLLFSSYETGDYLKDIDLATLVDGFGFHETPGDICHEIPWNDDYDSSFTAGVYI